MSSEIGYVALLIGLFVLPRVLQRWHIPSAITSLAAGGVLGMGFGLYEHDPTIKLLSTFGIVALFLFAGLEVNLEDLRPKARILAEHLVIWGVALAGVGWLVSRYLGLEARAAALVALALLTPSTGFILDSMGSWNLSDAARSWTRATAIAVELVALGVLFVTLQSQSVARLGLATGALAGMIVVLPLAFHAYARWVAPYAPRTEFAFLVMVAVVCAVATRRLGVYYLVGAFVVGMSAQRFARKLPAIASQEMLRTVEAFASLFVPFYFFHAGLRLRLDDFGPAALLAGLVFVAAAVPLRLVLVAAHRNIRLGERPRETLRISLPTLPTLVFTLVLAEILRDEFGAPAYVFGGLLVYTLVNTPIPGVILRRPRVATRLASVPALPAPAPAPAPADAPPPPRAAGGTE